MIQYPEYFEPGTRVLSEGERNDPTKFYHKCTRDLVYEGLRVDMVLAFMGAHKWKEDRTMYSVTHIQKFHDSVPFGSIMVNKGLPSAYQMEMFRFIQAYRKEFAGEKKAGYADEISADPISFTLFRLILSWAIEQWNVFLWTWTILQWNLMAPSISIDPLALHNLSVAEDHFIVHHDLTKTDQEGVLIHQKAVYCNPLDRMVCFGVSLGVWLAMEQQSFRDNSEKVFLRCGGKIGSASHHYCNQLLAIMKAKSDIVQTHLTRFSAHGLRKGSAHNIPSPIFSIAARGDWSLGKVLDVYWQFAEPVDAYLGRCLAGLDPNDSTFAVLPPHKIVTSSLEDIDIREGLEAMYGEIVRCHRNSTALLLRLLASVVHAPEWIRAVSVSNQRHPFSALTIFKNPDLLTHLRAKVTIEPTATMLKPTRISPHVKQLTLLTTLLELCQSTLIKVNEQTETTRLSIFDALELRALENGHITRANILDAFEDFKTSIEEGVGRRIDLLPAEGIGNHQGNQHLAAQQQGFQGGNQGGAAGSLSLYRGKFWDFDFPVGLRRDTGWRLWLLGMPAYGFRARGENDAEPAVRMVKTIQKVLTFAFANKIGQTFKLHWKPIYKMMKQN